MNDNFFAISSERILTPEGMKKGFLLIKDGEILDIATGDDSKPDCPIEDVGKAVLMPGLVDSHVHVNEPGRTEWEGFETATRAAAAGGITTIADMPLNSDPVTTTRDALEEKLQSTDGKLWVDCAFYGGVIPGNTDELEPLIQRGVRGFKCFLIHSGIDDFPDAKEADLRLAMPILARHNIPLLVHAELDCNGHSHGLNEKPSSYMAFLESRPRRWENEAIDLMIRLCREYNCKVHIVHLSSSDAIANIKQARQDGLPFTVETCPHYLTFAAEEIADGDPRFKCAPPIRERENREKLWHAVTNGIIDFVVSDHSPCSPSLKFLEEGNLAKAWGGISSLQFVLSAVWTGAQQRGATIADISGWLSKQPADFLGLEKRKGLLAPGFDADIVVWQPEERLTIERSMIHHRHKVTPYDGMNLHGRVLKTIVRGNTVFENGRHGDRPIGQMLLRTPVELRS
ncbi:MAG: allantoinase AllB [Cyanobacteria bacterium]|nr:allantoinase AllB [Cyanobacteriota bacterium]